MNKTKRILIVVFLGWLGIHKFIDGNYKIGILYLFTFGLFGIGWTIDIIKEITRNNCSIGKSLMNKEVLKKIASGELPIIDIDNVNFKENEICHYADKGYTFKDKTFTTGYTGRSSGVSIRIMKGVSYKTGTSGGRAIRETQRIIYKGTLILTNQRVIYISQNTPFDTKLASITSVIEVEDGIIIQIGSNSYSMVISTHTEFIKVFNMIKNKEV